MDLDKQILLADRKHQLSIVHSNVLSAEKKKLDIALNLRKIEEDKIKNETKALELEQEIEDLING